MISFTSLSFDQEEISLANNSVLHPSPGRRCRPFADLDEHRGCRGPSPLLAGPTGAQAVQDTTNSLHTKLALKVMQIAF
jgi:hypothetical protein